MPDAISQPTFLQPEKILVRGVNWLGDAVMSMPALMRLREAKPKAHITLLTHQKLGDLWRGNASIDEIKLFSGAENVWQIGRSLRESHFDIALAFPNSHRSALEFWLAGIPERIGYARPFRKFFLTQAVPRREGHLEMRKRSLAEINHLNAQPAGVQSPEISPSAHHIFQYLHLAATLGAKREAIAPQIVVSDAEISSFHERLRAISNATPSNWLGLIPGAEYGPAKRWPADRFIAAAVKLHEATGCGWIIFGAKDPATQRVSGELEKILGIASVVDFSGKTSVRELCAGMKFCTLVLTNDTGPMHIAAAVGTPVVVPFGSTSSHLTGPGLPGENRNLILQTNAACAPCFRRECPIDFRCLRSITVEDVVGACLRGFGKL
ncbi:MAG: lipopolysaccharide heptosyltransferase II [Verrucomicrobiota bacterium]